MRLHARWIALSRWSGQFDPRPLLARGPLEDLDDLSGLPPGLARALAESEGSVDAPSALRLGDPDYPRRLLDLAQPPALLWGEGDWSLLGRRALGVVGARACSGYGRSVASGLGAAAAREGVVLLSGAARGIDQAAHQGALDGCGPTVAVMGSGLGAGQRRIHRRIAESGLLLSELPPGTPPTRFTFPRRNRIIAALSSAVVVVEAARKSGTLHTANAAIRLGRPLLAVPGPIDAPASRGCNRLIAQGAQPLLCIDDALAALGEEERGLGPLLAALDEPRTVEQLSRALGAPARELVAQLVTLELTGGVRRLADQRYVRA